MGIVYEAEDIRLGRRVALKFVAEELATDAHALQRLHREARAASSLNHPNICVIYEIDEANGKTFIAMEFMDGQTLKHVMAGKALQTDRVITLGIQIADALEAAHSRGILHRDIKPANLFITRQEQVKVMDFGLAKLAWEETSIKVGDSTFSIKEECLTSRGATVGTLAYMSPEQVRGQDLDGRTDLFSFGVVLYEMATGVLPFRGETSGLILDGILNRTPTSAVRLNPEIPSDLESILRKSLEKNREVRYQHASDLAADLKRLKRDLDSAQLMVSLYNPGDSASQTRPSAVHTAVEDVEPVVQAHILRKLLVLIQIMYLSFYITALAKLESVQRFAELVLPGTGPILPEIVLVSAAVGIAIRLYLLSSLSFNHPQLGEKFRKLFPFLLVLDQFWGLSPLMLVNRIGLGLAFAAMAALLYLPFSQRTLVRMAYPFIRQTNELGIKVEIP